MTRFDSIVVGNDLVSEHWLAEQFPTAVAALRPAWKEREELGKPTPRSGLTALAGRFGALLVTAREHGGEDRLRAVHAAVRDALGLPGDETVWAGGRADSAITAVVPGSPSGAPPLLVLQARDAATVEDVLDGEGNGRLLTPATVDGKPEPVTARAISAAFLADEPPALVLVTAGAWLLLAERERWPEGRWLAIDLATACERRDTTARGELETIAALVSADALLPVDDGSVPLLGLIADSVKHAVGVSKDLRNGVRESIELLASEVLRRRRAAGLADGSGLAADLTRQCLRYLYRILFLLYAEARPELGVLPVGTPEYAEGYGLDRLRELVLTDLTRVSAEQGTHLHQSLEVLFRLVNEGHPPDTLGGDGEEPDDGGGLRFEALRADLFSRGATALIDEAGLGNGCLQDVLGRLLLSRKQRGRDRGFVSYAQLGINQLGAVYEGLMSYTGSIADTRMVEVARDGDPAKGSWVVPQSATAGFEDGWFVTTTDPQTGDVRRVTYAPGDFVFRLSGRDRQRSASYYTPEVLTRCVVTHSLAELLTEQTTSADVLRLSVCEPALGSGAFLVEAINQLAGEYLTRRQAELGTRIDPEQYPAELQKVKAFLALHNCYGVDLNATAVELAEITLWLDCMHPGLRAPWFGLHLRRGNSLIGARRETWTPAETAKRGWLTTVPAARPLGTALSAYEVHHFLLPAAGWGAVADTKEAKEGRPKATAELKAWRRAVTAVLGKTELTRLQGVAQRVEVLWALARRRLEIAEAEIRRPIPVWGADDLPAGTGAVQREQIEASLTDPGSAYRRLRRVMDAWAALWFWPVTTSIPPPTREQWISALEALLGTVSRTEARQGRGMWGDDATWADLDDAEHNEIVFGQMKPVDEVLTAHPWLEVCEGIAEREGFFHWELDFAPVFAKGGFDLQLGNPPWRPPQWKEPDVLAERDPWFSLYTSPGKIDADERRKRFMDRYGVYYLDSRAEDAGGTSFLSSTTIWPALADARSNVYKSFIVHTWSAAAERGVVGLLHPNAHLTDLDGAMLRANSYRRIRRLWSFVNQLKLFQEIGNTRPYCVAIYGDPRLPRFKCANQLYDPSTVDRSICHDGSGDLPGTKNEAGGWDTRPHLGRIIEVGLETLETWAKFLGDAGVESARLVTIPTAQAQEMLDRFQGVPRMRSISLSFSSGFAESDSRLRKYAAVERDWSGVVLQSPQIWVGSPLFQQPRATMKNHRDYDPIDLESLSANFIPRTSFHIGKSLESMPVSESFSLVWRRRIDVEMSRSLHPAILPPGCRHVELLWSAVFPEHRTLAVSAAVWSSLICDYLVKVTGIGDLREEAAGRMPDLGGSTLVPDIIHRILRLNCVTADYASLWRDLFDPLWLVDNWTDEHNRSPLSAVQKTWTTALPLRREGDRRQALLEIDAIVAAMLGMSADELCAMYRSQFGVLRKAERAMRFDANGIRVPRDVLKEYEKHGARSDLGRYVLPFTSVDREAEMTVAHEEFSRRLASRPPAASTVR